MFTQLARLLQAPQPQRQLPSAREAVAILLVEAARMDDTFGLDERAMIAHLLTQKFALSAEECGKLLADSEALSARMTQLHPYTHAIFEQMPMAERIELIEMLWDVAYADGVLDPEEDSLIRRIAGLIYVTDRDRVLARKKVLDRLAAKSS